MGRAGRRLWRPVRPRSCAHCPDTVHTPDDRTGLIHARTNLYVCANVRTRKVLVQVNGKNIERVTTNWTVAS